MLIQTSSKFWCPREDSNLHGLLHTDLNRARLPVPPLGLYLFQKNILRNNSSVNENIKVCRIGNTNDSQPVSFNCVAKNRDATSFGMIAKVSDKVRSQFSNKFCARMLPV